MADKKKEKLSLDIKDWCHQIKDTDMVIFEHFSSTSKRSDDEQIETMEEEDGAFAETKSLAVYQTPFGIVKVPEFCDINKHFKLWTMYTRYPITDKLKNGIDSMPGIETFEMLTPYRARVGICPLYKDGHVLRSIQTTIENLNSHESEKF